LLHLSGTHHFLFYANQQENLAMISSCNSTMPNNRFMALKQQQLNAQRNQAIKFGDTSVSTLPATAPASVLPASIAPTPAPVASGVAPQAPAFTPTTPAPAFNTAPVGSGSSVPAPKPLVPATAPGPAPAFAGITDVRWGSTYGAGQRLNQVV
jgi:hypothetical protein